MSVVAVEGVYKDGKIELSQAPEGVPSSSRVIVTFLDVESAEDAEAARKVAVEKMIASMREGLDLGGPPYPTREEIYGERIDRIIGRPDRH